MSWGFDLITTSKTFARYRVALVQAGHMVSYIPLIILYVSQFYAVMALGYLLLPPKVVVQALFGS